MILKVVKYPTVLRYSETVLREKVRCILKMKRRVGNFIPPSQFATAYFSPARARLYDFLIQSTILAAKSFIAV